MGLESFFKRTPKSPEQAKQDNKDAAALVGAGIAAVAAGGIGYEINKEPGLEQASLATAPAEVPVSAENPTVGMSSADAPKPVVVQRPEMSAPEQPQIVDLGEKSVVINLAEQQHIVEKPEL